MQVITMNEKKNPSVFPQEIPFGIEKELSHGAIVDVVTNEVNAPSATNPTSPMDNLNLQTEAAKAYQQKNSQG